MHKILTLFLLFPLITFAQTKTYTGVIKDISTNEPIPSVSVTLLNSNIGTISNEEGNFRITVPTDSKTVNLSHLSYKPYTIELEKMASMPELFLEPSAFDLEEVMILDKPADKVLADVIAASKNKLDKSLVLHTYYREFGKVNGVFNNFSDGLLDYYIKKKNGSADLYVKQSRAYQPKEIDEDQKSAYDAIPVFDVRDAVSNAYNFKRLSKLLDTKKYDFEIKTKSGKNGQTIAVAIITPKAEINEALLEGTVSYDLKTNLILEIDLKRAPDHQQYIKEMNLLLFRVTFLDEYRKSSFKTEGNQYIMTYNQNRVTIRIKTKKINDTFELYSDIMTMDYKEGVFELDKKQRYKEKNLFPLGKNYTSEYWKTDNIILLTNEEEKVLKTLK